MEKLFKKIAIVLLISMIIVSLIQFSANATEEKTEIIKTEEEYLIYKTETMKNSFQFAFSFDKDADTSTLSFINSITDAEGNNIAYVDKTFENTYFSAEKDTYMFVKQEDKIGNPEIIDLKTAITQETIDFVKTTSKRITTSVGKIEEEPVIDGNITKNTTVGCLKIEPKEGYTYEYKLVKLDGESSYQRLANLAKEISNFEENSNSYENISKINEFNELYNSLVPEKWNKVENNTILQPKDSKQNDEYIVWLKATDSNANEVVDIQFMTCTREENKQISTETVKEEVTTTTKLPVTFDSNMILIIVFAIIIVAIIVLLVLKKKTSSKHSK